MKNHSPRRYIRILNGGLVDTKLILPNVECYYTFDNKLYVEFIDGTDHYVGKIVLETDDLSDVKNYYEAITVKEN
jgi:hypothetical protein